MSFVEVLMSELVFRGYSLGGLETTAGRESGTLVK